MEKNEIIINGRLLNFKKIDDRSVAFQLIKDAMKDCDEDYVEVQGDFKI